ncbi:hypothetical protein AAG906_020157 [Vitis piasezkii]
MSPWHCVLVIYLTLITSSSAVDAITAEQQQQQQHLSLANQRLVWDSKLAHYAEWYANQRRRDCALKHSNGQYGENIFWGSGSGWTPAQAVAAWVSERRTTGPTPVLMAKNDTTPRLCGATRRVGCARVNCYGGRGVFMTCYDPPGNYIGERPY